ncbi:MAG: hypothetical protein Q7N50_04380 [Armatimonadota bacterium]|nr:hypothetical protein [Armatimonadota bacterium]
MSIQPPVSTWKCNTCGTANRLANATCVQCNNPRPADIAMPPAAPSQPIANPSMISQQPTIPAYPQPSQTQPGYGQPSAPQSSYVEPANMPVLLIIILVLEGIGILFGTISLLLRPVSLSPVSTIFDVAGYALASVMIIGFLLRWAPARKIGIARYSLSILDGFYGIFLGVQIASKGISAIPGMTPETMPQNPAGTPPMGMPPAGSQPPMPFDVSHIASASVIITAVFVIIISGLLLWYMTSKSVRNCLGEP